MKSITQTIQPWQAFLLGILIGAMGFYLFLENIDKQSNWYDNVAIESEEHHTHADFLVYINDEQLDFTDDKYQSRADNILNPDVHLHDNQGDVIHFHAAGVTLGEYLESVGFELTENCLVNDESARYCADENEVLELYINGQLSEQKTDIVLNDGDQMLLYFGEPNPAGLQAYLSEITDRACIYSGTCPERGTPPPEECGLTCEL